jgi:hypothetical protein
LRVRFARVGKTLLNALVSFRFSLMLRGAKGNQKITRNFDSRQKIVTTSQRFSTALFSIGFGERTVMGSTAATTMYFQYRTSGLLIRSMGMHWSNCLQI